LASERREAVAQYPGDKGVVELPIGVNNEIAGRPNSGPRNFRTEILNFLTGPMKSFGKNGQVMQNSGIGDAAGFRRSAAFVNDLSNAEDELASVHQTFAVGTIHRASTISGNSLASRPRKPLTRTMPTVRPSLSLKSISA